MTTQELTDPISATKPELSRRGFVLHGRRNVQAMFARLTVPHDVKIYDEAGHAFFDDTRSSYVAGPAADAWTRTLAWFHKYLA